MKLLFVWIFATLAGCTSTSSSESKSTTTTTPAAPPAPAIAPAAATKKQEPERPSVMLPQTLSDALASDFRRLDNKARDKYRHPHQTLEFFGLKRTMNVVEISPGAGWYEEILAPYLATEGHYTAARGVSYNPSPTVSETLKKHHPKTAERLSTTTMDLKTSDTVAPANSADLVLTFRNVHNWMTRGHEHKAFTAFYKALKPGGTLGVVEHRGNSKLPQADQTKAGYVREDEVIKMAEKAGFKLVAKSEINANPNDTKDYPEGVWTLPPTLKLGDKDRERYVLIGESDRMTLKFIKPR